MKTTTEKSGADFEAGAEKVHVSKRKLISCILGRASVVASFWLLLNPLLLLAQTTNPPSLYPRNRFLLVLETSHAMQRRADAMIESVRKLVGSAIAGQARRGDTLGLWTFNEEVYTGVFQLQKWSPDAQAQITERVEGFLKAQKFEKRARYDRLVPALSGLARNSPYITIALVCSGESDIHGTPFDDRINEFFRKWRLQPPDSGTPFVIALRAQAGRFVDCTMTPSPWTAELPQLPKELFVPLPVAEALPKEKTKPVTSSVPPLIISGRKHLASSNAPAVGATTTLAVAPSATDNRPTASEPTATPSAGQLSTSTGAVAPPSSTTPPAAINTGTQSAAALTLQSQTPSPMNAAVPEKSSNPPALAQNGPARESTDPGNSRAPVAQVSGQTVPPAVTAEDSGPNPNRQANSAPAQFATSVPVKKPVYYSLVLFVGAVSLCAVGGCVWFWRRRSHSVKESSLITESIERRRD